MVGSHLRTSFLLLKGSHWRLAPTVVAVAIAATLVVSVRTVSRSVQLAFDRVIDAMAGRASLEIRAGEGAMFSESLTAEVARIAGVSFATPVVAATAFTTDASGEVLTIYGIDVTDGEATRVHSALDQSDPEIDDPLVFVAQPDSIALVAEWAGRRGLGLEDTIELDTPVGRRKFVVRALLGAEGMARAFGGNLAIMDWQAAELLFTRAGFINRIDVVVDKTRDLHAVAESIATVLPRGIRVQTPAQRKADLHAVIASLHVLLAAVWVLGLVAAFLIAFNRLATTFDLASVDLAVLRALGLRQRGLHARLLTQAAVVGLAGIAIGIPLGLAVARVMTPVVARATALSHQLVTPPAAVRNDLVGALMGALLGIGAAILAAAGPARRAARVPIVETLRARSAAEPETKGARIGRMRVGCLLVGIGCLVLGAVTRMAFASMVASVLLLVWALTEVRPLLGRRARASRGETRRPGSTWGFARRLLLLDQRRSSVTITMMAVCLGLVVWLWTVSTSFERSVASAMEGALHGDLVVGSVHTRTGLVEAPLDESLLAELSAIPGVARVVGEQAFEWSYAGGPIMLNGFDPVYFADGERFGEWPLIGRSVPGAWAKVARGEAVVVSSNFTRNLGLGVGDELSVDTPTGALTLPIVGVVSDFFSPRGTIEISRDLLKTRWNSAQIIRALIAVDESRPTELVKSDVYRRVGHRFQVRVMMLDETIRWFQSQVRRAFGALYALSGLVVVVVCLGIADTLVAGTWEQRRVLGVTRAIGRRRGWVRGVVVAQATYLFACGMAAALVTGIGLGMLWVRFTLPDLLGWSLELSVPWTALLGLTAAGLVLSLVSAVLPALRAGRWSQPAALQVE